jgi:hypothetical protein
MISPASAYFGVMHSSASGISALALMGGMAAAFLTMREELNSQKDSLR